MRYCPGRSPAVVQGTGLANRARTVAAGGEDLALRQLRQWAILGRDAATKQLHKTAVWAAVMRQTADGTLPSMEELDANAVVDYPAPAGEPAVAPDDG